MYMVLLAVILVMAVLDVFLFFVIRQIVIITNRQVQRHLTAELEVCGKELEETMGRLLEARQELEAAEQQKAAAVEAQGEDQAVSGAALSRLAPVPGFRHPRYRSEESLETYRYIRDHLKLDYEELVRRALEICPAPDAEWENCRRIREKIDFSRMYELLLRPQEEQDACLEELLTEEELATLERVAPGGQYPDLTVRMDMVRQYIRFHDPQLWVECGDKDLQKEGDGRIRVSYNPQIHEGFRLHIGQGVLDYSL